MSTEIRDDDQIRVEFHKGIFQGFVNNDKNQFKIMFKNGNDSKNKAFVLLKDKIYIKTAIYGTLTIPTVIKTLNSSPASSPSPSKRIRLTPSSCHFKTLIKDVIGIIATFLTFEEYLSFCLINKRIHEKLKEFKFLTSFDSIKYTTTNKDDFLYKNLDKFPQLQYLSLFGEELNKIKFSKAHKNLTRLSLNGNDLESTEWISSKDFNDSSIECLQLSYFGALDDRWSWMFNFDPALFTKIKYLFMDNCDMQHTDCNDKLMINTISEFFKDLKGYGYYDGAGQFTTNVPFTNWILARFGSRLEVLHIQDHDNIEIPLDAKFKFQNLKELRIILSKHNNNDMSLIDIILAKTDKNTVQRFALEIQSLSSLYRRGDFKRSMERLFATQQNLKQFRLIDRYKYRNYAYDAIEFGLNSSSFKSKNTMILTTRFIDCSPTYSNKNMDASEINVIGQRLNNSLLGCYQEMNYQLRMEFVGSVFDIYKEFQMNENIVKKLKSRHQVNIKYSKRKYTDTLCLVIHSKKSTVLEPYRWTFPMEHTDFGERHEFEDNYSNNLIRCSEEDEYYTET